MLYEYVREIENGQEKEDKRLKDAVHTHLCSGVRSTSMLRVSYEVPRATCNVS